MKAQYRLTLVGMMAMIVGLGCNLPAYIRLVGTSVPQPSQQPTASANAASQLQIFETAWEAVRDQYVRADYNGVDWNAVGDQYRARISAGLSDDEFAQAMRDMLAELPQGQASYQTRAERLEADSADTSQYQGIGAFIAFRTEPEPHVVILSVIEDSPAEQAGLQPHDSIYAIDGESVRADESETVATRIRGPANTSVTVTVQSPGGRRRNLTIPRGQITAADVLRGGEIPAAHVAYYRLPVVADPDMPQLIAQNLQELGAQSELKGVILDLRVSHAGGQGWPLGEMLTLFGDSALGEFYTRTTTETVTVEGQDLAGSQTVPLVILIGPDTQGSSEIFAGALQGAKRAVLVGLPTPGDVEGFSEIPLSDGSRLFLATSSFRTLDGADLALSGLKPNVTVSDDWDQVSVDNDPVLAAAVGLLTE